MTKGWAVMRIMTGTEPFIMKTDSEEIALKCAKDFARRPNVEYCSVLKTGWDPIHNKYTGIETHREYPPETKEKETTNEL